MLELPVKLRLDVGHKINTLRKKGLVPAILYGHKVKNTPLTIDALKLGKVYKEAGENTLIKLKITGQATGQGKEDKAKIEERVVLIYDLVKDPVSEDILHVDLYQVKMDEPISAEVPLVFVGESPVVEQEGGLLVKTIQHVEVEALPKDLPHNIEVDISLLKTYDNKVSIKDLKVPANVKIMADEEDVVASVVPPRSEEELEALEEKPEEEVGEVKVEGKVEGEEKKEEEEESKEGTEEKKE